MKVFSVVGGCAGKTETVRRLVAEIVRRGLRVSTVKRVPEAVDLEKPGSGTWKHREAGAQEVILASTRRMALLREMSTDADEPDVEAPAGAPDSRGNRVSGRFPAYVLSQVGVRSTRTGQAADRA
jgi:Molybdopterin guanine dinucleotide synthesis protein B